MSGLPVVAGEQDVDSLPGFSFEVHSVCAKDSQDKHLKFTESRCARDQTHAEVPKEISDADRSQILNACEVEALEFADDADNRHLFGHL